MASLVRLYKVAVVARYELVAVLRSIACYNVIMGFRAPRMFVCPCCVASSRGGPRHVESSRVSHESSSDRNVLQFLTVGIVELY